MKSIDQTGSKSAAIEPSPARTIRNDKGKILLYSWDDFVEDVCHGPNCFICGSRPRDKKFNDEHVVPNWLLHAFDLHALKLTLPNGNTHQYGTYTVPCCEECNSAMARTFEEPMSKLLENGAGAIQEHIAVNGPLIPYTWMALIFLKIHLKDRRLRRHLDKREGDEPVSADYIWENMHHLHAVARGFHVNANVEPEAFGSMFVFPVKDEGTRDTFDLVTFTAAQTLYIRLGDTGVVAVFDDACAVLNGLEGLIRRIRGPVNWMQAREIAARMAMANLDLVNRPRFWTLVKPTLDVSIGGTIGDVPKFRDVDQALFGDLMASAFQTLPPMDGYQPDAAMAALRAGKMTFLFDDLGNFIREQKR